MSYGPCKACPSAVAAWQLSVEAVRTVPESALLCLDHLQKLIRGRRDAALREARNASRRFCSCGNEIYLFFQTNDEIRLTCQRCVLGLHPAVGRNTEVTPVSVKVPETWYSAKSCDEEDCAAKMVWQYGDGTVRCAKHGAAAEPEDAHA